MTTYLEIFKQISVLLFVVMVSLNFYTPVNFYANAFKNINKTVQSVTTFRPSSNSTCEDVVQITANGATLGNSGTTGGLTCIGCTVTNEENLLDNDFTTFASIVIPVGLLGNGYVSVKLGQTFPAGTRAGFTMDVNGGVAGVLNGTTLISYLNGVEQQRINGANLLNLLGIAGNSNVTGVFCTSFDELRIEAASLVGVVSTYRVFNAIVTENAQFPVQCGLATASAEVCEDCIDNDGDGLLDYEDNRCYADGCIPVEATTTNGATLGNSGTSGGLLCLACNVSNEANLIDDDLTNFASINLTVGLGGSGHVSVKYGQTFPAGTRAGFVIDVNGGVAGLLNATSLTSYLNGSPQQTIDGGNLLNLLGIGGGTNIAGIFCDPFDELRLDAGGLLGVAASYRVYYSYVDESAQFPVQCGLATSSTEVCGDCIDNDGDGLLDNEDDDCANEAPSITNPVSIVVNENLEGIAVDLDANDDLDVEGLGLSYRFAGGVESEDEDLFNIDPVSGEVAFKAKPNFESPIDRNGDNVYQVKVAAIDSRNLLATKVLQIKVQDTCEAEKMILSYDNTTSSKTPIQPR